MQHSKQRFVWWSFAFLLVVVAVVLGVLRSQAPLSVWMIGEGEVADELARRAAAGDPVEAEQLDWNKERSGLSWTILGPMPQGSRERLTDPSELKRVALVQAEALDWLIDDETGRSSWLETFGDAELLTLDELELGERWKALEWMQRDPARWTAATVEDRIDRVIRSWALRTEVGDPCELRVLAGLDLFLSSSALSPGAVAPELLLPDPFWVFACADHYAAQLDEAAVMGSMPDVLDAARRYHCLLAATCVPVNLVRGLVDVRIYGQGVRQIEAVLPLLSEKGQRELMSLFTDLDEDRGDRYLRATRGERAFLHHSYTKLIETGVSPFGSGAPVGPLHGEFLICLADYDALFAALEAPSYHETMEQMRALEAEIAGSDRGELSKMAVRGASSSFLPFARNVALQRCARIAALRVTDGVEAAEARAAHTQDPFDGNPLRTRLRDDGVFEVWSVGEDGLDDGGSTAAAPAGSDRDIVFRAPARTD